MSRQSASHTAWWPPASILIACHVPCFPPLSPAGGAPAFSRAALQPARPGAAAAAGCTAAPGEHAGGPRLGGVNGLGMGDEYSILSTRMQECGAAMLSIAAHLRLLGLSASCAAPPRCYISLRFSSHCSYGQKARPCHYCQHSFRPWPLPIGFRVHELRLGLAGLWCARRGSVQRAARRARPLASRRRAGAALRQGHALRPEGADPRRPGHGQVEPAQAAARRRLLAHLRAEHADTDGQDCVEVRQRAGRRGEHRHVGGDRQARECGW